MFKHLNAVTICPATGLGSELIDIQKDFRFDHDNFYVPAEVYDHFKNTFGARGDAAYANYNKAMDAFKAKDPEAYAKFADSLKAKSYNVEYPAFETGSQASTRVASGKALNFFMNKLDNLFGGSADVAGSVMTKLDNGTNYFVDNRSGHNMNWGIREFAMASAQNGMLLHGGVRSYVGCFFVFSDYMKPAIRMAALSHLPAIYLFSHDSIAVGEDGPTHEPIEQMAMLRISLLMFFLVWKVWLSLMKLMIL